MVNFLSEDVIKKRDVNSWLYKLVVSGCIIVILLMNTGCKNETSGTLRIAIASNLAEPITTLMERFEAESNIKTDIIIGSSGKHTAQIMHGAPYDIFISADTKYLDSLFKAGHLLETPKKFLEGSLILWSSKKSVMKGIEVLTNVEFEKMAIPNPTTAPYGIAAHEALENLGLWSKVQGKLVYGESVTQTNQFILTEAVQAGITSQSLIHSKQLDLSGKWIPLNTELHNPIQHGISILASTNKLADCQRLIQFLFSEASRSLLTEYGYKIST